MPKEFRTYVEDVDRTLYDVHDATDASRYLDAGLTRRRRTSRPGCSTSA